MAEKYLIVIHGAGIDPWALVETPYAGQQRPVVNVVHRCLSRTDALGRPVKSVVEVWGALPEAQDDTGAIVLPVLEHTVVHRPEVGSGIKRVTLFRRKAHLDYRTFVAWYTGHHVDLAREMGLEGYVTHTVVEAAAGEVDGVAMFWFRDEDQERHAYDTTRRVRRRINADAVANVDALVTYRVVEELRAGLT